jgi:hypothetical protein
MDRHEPGNDQLKIRIKEAKKAEKKSGKIKSQKNKRR